MVQYRKSMHPSALSGQLSGHNKKDGKGGHGTQEADELRRPCGIAGEFCKKILTILSIIKTLLTFSLRPR